MIKKININNNNFEYGTKEIIIIGSAHVSKKNIEQVQNIIIDEQPEIIGVELDRNRFRNILEEKENNIKFTDIFKTNNIFLFIITYFLSNYQKKIAKKLNTKAGGEMLSAIKCAKIINSKIALLDRDINITLNKLLKNISFKEKLKILFGGFFLNKKEKEILKNVNINTLLYEVENTENNSKFLEEIMKIFSKKFKKLKEILIDERDQFIAYNILKAPCKKMVVIIGAGHLKGVEKNLNKKKFNLKKILSVNYKYKN
jgi:pheromone shutdown-related protein TraB